MITTLADEVLQGAQLMFVFRSARKTESRLFVSCTARFTEINLCSLYTVSLTAHNSTAHQTASSSHWAGSFFTIWRRSGVLHSQIYCIKNLVDFLWGDLGNVGSLFDTNVGHLFEKSMKIVSWSKTLMLKRQPAVTNPELFQLYQQTTPWQQTQHI